MSAPSYDERDALRRAVSDLYEMIVTEFDRNPMPVRAYLSKPETDSYWAQHAVELSRQRDRRRAAARQRLAESRGAAPGRAEGETT